MEVTFIMPHVGRKKNQPYVKTWQMDLFLAWCGDNHIDPNMFGIIGILKWSDQINVNK